MFSIAEKRMIADEIEKILLKLDHPEMPKKNPTFKLHVYGNEEWSWADIEPNWKNREDKAINPWNEVARDILK